MYLVINRIIFSLSIFVLLSTTIFARDIKNQEILTPKTTVWDFTYEEDSDSPDNNPIKRYEKIKKEVEKIIGLFPRFFKISECLEDDFTNTYCPEALEKADEFWSYKDSSEVITRKDNVEDFTNSIYTIHTGTVRDYVNGEYLPHVNTEINYSRGESKEYTGYVTDYTTKITNTITTSPTKTVYGLFRVIQGKGLINGRWANVGTIISSGDSDSNGHIFFEATNGCKIQNKNLSPSFMNIGSTIRIGTFIGSAEGDNDWEDGFITIECYGNNTTLSCPSDMTLENNVCSKTSSICPSGYTETTGTETAKGQCKKLVAYNYYSYGCPTGYVVQNAGFTTWTKTDPNYSAINYDTLDDSVNSKTPPNNNCIQSLESTAYEYVCGAGYIPFDAGLTTCPAGTSGTCNNKYPPESNCYKDVKYKFYEYGCPNPYKTDNHGLKECIKTDPDKTRNNESTLNDDCNDAKAPDGNCVAEYEYEYYEYLCEGENTFNEEYNPIDEGLTECIKTDNDITSTNNLGVPCNSKTPPKDNCRAKEYTCNSEFINPAFVDGEWKCSPFACNIDNKCGYATCNGYSINHALMPREYNPLLTIIKTGEACQPKSCESKTIYDDGIATKKEKKICNIGTPIGDKCITNKVNGICPNNFSLNSDGKCEKDFDKYYYYYDYTCKDLTWTLTVNNRDPGCIDDTFGNCLSFDKQTAVCKKNTYVCPSTGKECILNEDNEYKCETECNAEFVDKPPCYDEICDAVLNDQMSYCGTSNCPSQFGVFKENNKCYIELCPEGTVETIEGDCIDE